MAENRNTESGAAQSTAPEAAIGAGDEVQSFVSRTPDVGDVKKIYQFSHIKELRRENVRYWTDAMEEQLELQDAWVAVTKYNEVGRDLYYALLERRPGWRKLDLKAKAILKSAMSENARLSKSGLLESCGNAYEVTTGRRQWQIE